MKKIMNLFVLVAAAAMALVSCQKPEVDNPAPQEYEYTFLIGGADDAESKAAIGNENVVWEEGDRMGVYTKVAAGTISNNAYGDITPGAPATMKMYSNQALATGDYIYAYYPYDESNKNGNLTVTLNIPTIQDGKDDMPMVAIPHCVESAISTGQQNAPVGKIKFANLGSVIEFHVYSTTEAYQTELVKSVTFNADQAIAGNFTFDISAVDYSDEETLAIAGYEATSVVSTLSTSTQVSADKNAATVVKMVVAPGTYTGNIVVTTDKATYTYPISTPKEFNRSAVKPLGLNLRENVREENTSSEPEEVTATLTFDDAAKRIVSTTIQQVWVENDITLTYNKAGYNNNLAEYEKPVRFYANTTITLEAPGNIEAIEFACNTSTYASALHQAISGSSLNGKLVTVTLDGSSPTVTYTMTAQVRMDALTVKYAKADPTVPSITAGNVTGVSARGVEAAELTYEIANLEYSDLTVTCDGTVVTSASKGEDGEINYVVSANSTTSSRDGSITISNGTLTKEVKVSQLAPVFKVSRNAVELGATAGSQTSVTVTSDFDWMLSKEGAGYTVTPTSYTWAGDGKKEVTIQATANRTEEGVADLGTITLVNSTTGQELTIKVTQATSYVNQESETVTMNIYANKGTLSGKSISWTQNGFTVTNNQAKSTTAIRTSDSDHFRLYANSELIFTSSSKKFNKVVVTCSSSSYTDELQTSAKNAGLTATVSGSEVTISTSSPTTAMPTITMSAQSRIKKVVVELN